MNLDQSDLFGNGKSQDEVHISSAIELLTKNGYRVLDTTRPEDAKAAAIEAGYKVSDPIFVNGGVKTLKDLRNYFYMRLWKKYPGRQAYYVDMGLSKELHLFKLFVESREVTGLSRLNAIQECVAIIDIIFDHEDEFGFRDPIDVRVIGQGKAGWITRKAVFILNKKVQESMHQKFNKMVAKYEQDEKIDLKDKASELDSLLIEMEENNG